MATYDEIYHALHSGLEPPKDDWEKFIRHCNSEIISKFKRYGHRMDDFTIISDLLSDLMCQIMRNIKKETFNPNQGTFKNYVDGIILNMIRKYFAKQKREKKGLENYKEHILATSAVIESKSDEETEKLEYLKERLTLQEYQVVYYRLFRDLSTEETAKRLGKTNQQISRTLNKAKKKLTGG